MAEDEGQERTEDATARRRQQAREKGQVPRSRELASAAVLIVGALSLIWFGPELGKALMAVMRQLFVLTREEIFDVSALGIVVYNTIYITVWPLTQVLFTLFVAAFLSAIALGGISFSWEAARPKLSKMNPMQGIKRMFSKQSVLELVKSILKVLLVSGVAYYLIMGSLNEFYELHIETFPTNLYHSLDILMNFVLLICCSLLVVLFIDVPFQIWQHNEELKMTKQEIKDEYKDTEGKPEVKGRIRMLQREMAQRRMMAEVPLADVIITNPEHYSVALRYDSKTERAPVVVAKGSDFMALKIREIAREHDVPLVPAAPLARAIYYSTELDQPIPDGLFAAVAQLLAYVFLLKQFQKGRGKRPKAPQDKQLPIPTELRR